MAQTGKESVDYVEKRRTNACNMDYTLPLLVSNTEVHAEVRHKIP